MSAITLQLPDDLALRLQGQEDRLPEILELGLRDILTDGQPGFAGANEVLETLASLPSPEEVLSLRPSAHLTARVEELLTINQARGFTDLEQREWDRYEYLEHLVRMAKASAHRRLNLSAGGERS